MSGLHHPIHAITLDLDDTLWPSRPTLVHAEQVLSAWLAEHAPATHAASTPALRNAIRDIVMSAHPDRVHDVSFMRRESLRRAMIVAGDDPQMAAAAFEVFLDARQRVDLYPDVLPVLERWARRYRVVAVSNGNADVERVGLGRFFHATVSAHDYPFGKPDPRIFREACRLAGIDDPHAVLHVGDDLSLDIDGARAIGMQTAWIQRPDLAAPSIRSPNPGGPKHDAQPHRRDPVRQHDPAKASAFTAPAFTDLAALDAALQAHSHSANS